MKNILFYILSCIYFVTINLSGDSIYLDEHIRRALLVITDNEFNHHMYCKATYEDKLIIIWDIFVKFIKTPIEIYIYYYFSNPLFMFDPALIHKFIYALRKKCF